MRGAGRSPFGGSLPGTSGGARTYVVVFLLVLLVLVLGLFGVLSICRDSVSRTAQRAVETARAQPPAVASAASFPPPIPTATPTAPPPSFSPSPAVGSPLAASPSPAGGERVHVVQAGDSLFAIAQRYNVSLDDLLRANNLTRDSVLQIGQRIVIP